MKDIDFEKEIMNAMKNMDHSNEPATRLDSILYELRVFVSSGVFSVEKFRKEVLAKFNFDFKDFSEVAEQNKKMLLKCASQQDAIQTINDLQKMSHPVASQLQFGAAASKVASNFISNLEHQLFSK
jgi:hypothetical protein